jgi:MFS family permease
LIDLAYNPSASVLGLLVSIMYVGGMIAIPIAPYVADTFGRRVGVVIGSVIMLVGVALVSIGYHVELFIIGRLILGLGLGIAQVSGTSYCRILCFPVVNLMRRKQECSPLLLSELVHPQHRPQYSTLYNALWYVGSLIGACVALGKFPQI